MYAKTKKNWGYLNISSHISYKNPQNLSRRFAKCHASEYNAHGPSKTIKARPLAASCACSAGHELASPDLVSAFGSGFLTTDVDDVPDANLASYPGTTSARLTSSSVGTALV